MRREATSNQRTSDCYLSNRGERYTTAMLARRATLVNQPVVPYVYPLPTAETRMPWISFIIRQAYGVAGSLQYRAGKINADDRFIQNHCLQDGCGMCGYEKLTGM